jgi:uncharacterized membrane protein (UPF0127 family)
LLASVRVEVADEPSERSQGLMGRAPLPDDTGMLFVFESAGAWCFWMRDTPSPLSIAFARPDGRVVAIEDMQPFDEALHCPPEPVQLALEVPQGYFARRGVQVGDTLVRPQLRLPLTFRHGSDRD